MNSSTGRAPRGTAVTLIVGELLTQPQAWAYCGLKRSTWFACKQRGMGPAETKLPTGGVRYRRRDLDRWIELLVKREQKRATRP